MKKVRPWVEALGISEDDYQRWTSSLPADQSVTFHCLSEGRIPVPAYLEWAKNHYQLPVLDNRFFAQKIENNIFEQLQSFSSWSKELIPVGEWDGVIYLACVEPIEDMSWSFHVCYLLADPHQLEKYWNQLNSSGAVETAPAVPVAAPEPEKIAMAYPPEPKVPTPDTAPMLASATLSDSAPISVAHVETPSQPVSSAPASSDLFASLEADLTKTNAAPVEAEKPKESAKESLDDLMPAGLNINIAALPDLPENTMTAIFPIADANKKDEVPVVAAPTLNIDPVAQAGANAFLQDLKSDFQSAMILKFENESLHPLAWDSGFKNSQPSPVLLSTASAFRIVYRTKMPYLGHVVETPVNQEFFKNWGFVKAPEMILVQPITNGSEWLGMLLLVADKSKKQSLLLNSAEASAKKIAGHWPQIHSKAA